MNSLIKDLKHATLIFSKILITHLLTKKEISNTMNNFCCTIGEDLASNINDAPNPLLSGGFTERSSSIRFKF